MWGRDAYGKWEKWESGKWSRMKFISRHLYLIACADVFSFPLFQIKYNINMARRVANATRRSADGASIPFVGAVQSKTRPSPLLPIGLLVVVWCSPAIALFCSLSWSYLVLWKPSLVKIYNLYTLISLKGYPFSFIFFCFHWLTNADTNSSDLFWPLSLPVPFQGAILLIGYSSSGSGVYLMFLFCKSFAGEIPSCLSSISSSPHFFFVL